MMLTRRSVTVGSAALATSALVLGPEALAAPRRRRHRKTSAEGGQVVLDWELITFRTVYPVPLYPTISEQLQLAVGYAVAGDKTPEAAVEDAWRAVQAEAARPRGPTGQRRRERCCRKDECKQRGE